MCRRGFVRRQRCPRCRKRDGRPPSRPCVSVCVMTEMRRRERAGKRWRQRAEWEMKGYLEAREGVARILRGGKDVLDGAKASGGPQVGCAL
jgi:hypothetical protein